MKYLIASDIHGSKRATQMVLDHFKAEGADMLILLGDLLYHGPRNDLPQEYDPRAVAALLNGMKDRIIAVRGNCEAEVDQMVLQFPVMADYAVLELDGHVIYATHGHVYNVSHLPPLCRGDILLQGHTHIPACVEQDGILCLNPGSVSLPKEGSARSYMTFDGEVFCWKTLDGCTYRSFPLADRA